MLYFLLTLVSVYGTDDRGVARAPTLMLPTASADVRAAHVEDILMVVSSRMPIDGRRAGQEFLARDLTLRRVRSVTSAAGVFDLKRKRDVQMNVSRRRGKKVIRDCFCEMSKIDPVTPQGVISSCMHRSSVLRPRGKRFDLVR